MPLARTSLPGRWLRRRSRRSDNFVFANRSHKPQVRVASKLQHRSAMHAVSLVAIPSGLTLAAIGSLGSPTVGSAIAPDLSKNPPERGLHPVERRRPF